ncbi:sigma-70 family RNA polymerase sigma factor [Clostridium sp.]|uniref:RNA polymerase sigma factor n=1 Tax=Clostridium sp. TaxID=1506 RepID=UPI0025BCBF01|nr:sigma-70 family RNA polymerase sigma factor [Clostridium sp.]
MVDNELKLIDNIQKKRSREASNIIIKSYYKEIYMYIYKQLLDKELSLDITQEVFINMIKSIDTYNKKKCSFRTWLYKIASNKIIDYYRSKSYKKLLKLKPIDEIDIKSDFNIEDDFINGEKIKEILKIVNGFESYLQQIFRLKIFSDMTFKDIGCLLELSESTVKTRYYSLIKKIKSEVEEDSYEERV